MWRPWRADVAVSGDRIVDSLGLRQSVVGHTFVALATTAELFTLVFAASRWHRTGAPGRQPAWLGVPLRAVLVGYAVVFKRVGRVGGGLLVATYGAYLAFTFR